MKYRFVEKLNEFLNSMGRSDLINSQLDCHSNIQLEMNDSPAINIDLSTDELIIWCNLAECNYSRLDSVSASLLRSLIEYPPRNFQPGQPALNIIDNTLVLSAVLKEKSMDNMQLFADSFEEFFERANEIRTQLV
ncbi:type III secretion system chaperone SpaK [Providencia rustigianii]|uniref:Invasion protein B family n=2 Tax=Providencia rustigianii TaxID=158850 RepID=D1P126_9GAMM|nr:MULTISPECIES: type III secretion system protein [Providencia]EFB73045.1 invasion protein B family [Providencia rustigianii DSM 4541]MTC56866.1 type III secretion system protein [Providencia rustigianii]MTC59649.1 type III secretion system protein [Providencia rustigianii]SPY76077.1 type III secretion system chaperone SpaK [Providencia rustigianii]SUC25223.1 type III secretion system chaperone SpaK [Providencia rustigianii]